MQTEEVELRDSLGRVGNLLAERRVVREVVNPMLAIVYILVSFVYFFFQYQMMSLFLNMRTLGVFIMKIKNHN